MEGDLVVTRFGLHSGLRQSGAQSSQMRNEWDTRCMDHPPFVQLDGPLLLSFPSGSAHKPNSSIENFLQVWLIIFPIQRLP
jgi:hypothetical protein